MIDSNKILFYLTSNKKRLEKKYHLIKIGIFGSVARGEQNEQSDIDIIVEFENGTQNLFTLKQRLKKKFNQNSICQLIYVVKNTLSQFLNNKSSQKQNMPKLSHKDFSCVINMLE